MRLALVALLLVACGETAPPTAPRVRPAGSQIGTVCFEHEVDGGGWELVSVRDADGGLPDRASAVRGSWYFPMDAGPLRLRGCSPY